MTSSRHLKDSSLLLILLFSMLLRLFYWNSYQTIWWDSAVYLNIGRYLFSHGAVGFIEPLRPLALPFLLGASWKLGMNDILISRLLGLTFSMLLITATYLLGKSYNKDVATISAIIVSLSTIAFSFTFRNYTEIPAAFFIVLALWNNGRKNSYFAGVCAALAFLFKFPAGIVLLALIVTEKQFSRNAKIIAAFALTVAPYFILNLIWYGSFFKPLIEGSAIIKEAGIWLFSQPWSFYFIEIFKDNFLHIFAVLGIFITAFAKGRRSIVVALILLLGYFISLQHKEPRFMVLFLPLLAILTAVGINKIFASAKTGIYVFLITLFIFFLAVPQTFDQYSLSKYHTFLKGKQFSKEVLTMQPIVGLYAVKSVTPAYFPVFNAVLAERWIKYLSENKEKIDYIFLDTCEGGMLCPPDDKICPEKQEELISLAKSLFSTAYEKETAACRHYVFKAIR